MAVGIVINAKVMQRNMQLNRQLQPLLTYAHSKANPFLLVRRG